MVRIILGGCSGRMGHVVRGIVDENEDMQVVAGIDIVQGDADFPVFSDAAECNIPADVIIDFSSPKALNGVLALAEEKQLAAVLCATGYSPEQIEQINAASQKIAILRSANMSLGINTMAKLIAEAA